MVRLGPHNAINNNGSNYDALDFLAKLFARVERVREQPKQPVGVIIFFAEEEAGARPIAILGSFSINLDDGGGAGGGARMREREGGRDLPRFHDASGRAAGRTI